MTNETDNKIDISVVVPLFNEEESLPELHAWIERVMVANGFSYEIVFVNDGSTDHSWDVIEDLAKKNPNVHGIKFRRNYGKSPALYCGFEIVKGDVVITMDADLQDPPALLPEMLGYLESGEYLGKVRMNEPPQWIQGIAYYDGWMYITADDGSADADEPDHVYKCLVDPDLDEFSVLPEKTLDDVTRQGEIEGISFDKDKKHMLISYNRGAIIVKGMPTGFYDGYDKEIHEIFVYWCPQ